MMSGSDEAGVMKVVRWVLLGLVVVLLSVMSGVVGFVIGEGSGDGGPASVGPFSSSNGEADFEVLNEIYDILQQDFVDQESLDPEILRQGAIDGLLATLGDVHTLYIDPVSLALGVDIISGQFEGIGARVEQDPITREITIVAPFRDSPAEEAGIRTGDVILAVDGESTAGWTVSQAVRRIRGPEGTDVVLSVRHPNGEEEDITITRAMISIPTVTTREIEDASGNVVADIAYVELEQITERTIPDLVPVLEEIVTEGYQGLVLDLRRNPGGSLNATVEVADLFLEGGVILTQVDKDGSETVFEADAGDVAESLPVVALVGPGSASGAEVIAGALRDNQRAVLIGETTFGKGAVNHLRDLSDGGALYVTIARWLTPSGEQIEGIGLIPDIEVVPTEEDIEEGQDVQLFRALEYLRESMQAAVP